MLSKEELLKTRFKVIADDPNKVFPLGSIIINPVKDFEEELNRFPDIFKKLDYREDREPGELPDINELL